MGSRQRLHSLLDGGRIQGSVVRSSQPNDAVHERKHVVGAMVPSSRSLCSDSSRDLDPAIFRAVDLRAEVIDHAAVVIVNWAEVKLIPERYPSLR